MHVISSTDVERIVDRYEMPAVVDQRADLVDEPGTVMFLVHAPFVCRGEKRRVQDDAIEELFGALEPGNGREEVLRDEVFLLDGDAVEGTRVLGEIQELTIVVSLYDAGRSTCGRCDAQTARAGKGVQHRFSLHIFDQPFAQFASIEIKAGVPVESQVKGVPNPVFFDARVWLVAEKQESVSFGGRFAVTGLENSSV